MIFDIANEICLAIWARGAWKQVAVHEGVSQRGLDVDATVNSESFSARGPLLVAV